MKKPRLSDWILVFWLAFVVACIIHYAPKPKAQHYQMVPMR